MAASKPICSIDGCNKLSFARGLCRCHYDRDRLEKAGPCSIDGCDRPAYKRGMCNGHYKRTVRHGDPSGGRTWRGEVPKFLDQAVAHSGGECLLWPYGRTDGGYGIVWIDGAHYLAHRIVCELAHGAPPSPAHEAAHSCGNGNLGCVNPGHISWKTKVDNEADKIEHGTIARGERVASAKLTERQVREIRALEGSDTYTNIAARFGVTLNTIKRIQRRERWAWVE